MNFLQTDARAGLRRGIGSTLLGIAAACCALSAGAQTPAEAYPTRPLSIIVANPPGSATDTLARMVSDVLQRAWGQSVVVENKPGAQGVIGVQALKKASADGHTLIISFSGLNSSGPWLQAQPAYHYKNDFTPIVPLVRAPSLLVVRADSPYASLEDLVKAGRAAPGRITYGYGQATSQVMGGAFAHAAGMAEAVGIPYRGQPQALADLVGGQFDFMFADLSVVKPFTEAGKLRSLGISTRERSKLMPDVPTLDEQGIPGYDLAAWVGLSGPAGMPAPVVQAINAQVRKAFAADDVQQRIQQLGFTPLDADPAAFAAFVDHEYETWGRAIQAAGIEPQ